MLRFRQTRTSKRFVAVHGSVHNLFNTERTSFGRQNIKVNRAAALAEWRGLLAA